MRIATAIIALLSAMGAWAFPTDVNLWYDKPAGQWEETLPLGNGRLGMMPDGGVDHEKIVLNEISMWSGSVADYGNPNAAKSLPEIQGLLCEGRNKEAQELMFATFMPSKPETGGTYGMYQMVGDLDIDFSYQPGAVSDYMRRLDLSEAVAYTTFCVGETRYVREYFVPRGKDVMLVHIYADRPGTVTLGVGISRPERGSVSLKTDDVLLLEGSLDSGKDGVDGMRYAAAVRVIPVGGEISASGDKKIKVDGADEAWIAVAAATDFAYTCTSHPAAPGEAVVIVDGLTVAELADYKREGISEFRRLFGRAGVSLARSATSALPTDQRLEAYQSNPDPELAALYYNYGRYLLICSTLPGYLPPNLQGLWANGCATPWNGDYHTNINVQMNHWPVEPGNLSELHRPLIELVKGAVKSGERTARTFYGDNARGWVMHMMTNVWGYTEPGEHPLGGATNTGGAWLCAHLWEHYLYHPADTAYLREIYPVMKGAADFFLSTMIREPKHGWLVTGPSSSPENQFFLPGDSLTSLSVCLGPTMDIQLVRELFGNVSAAAGILGCDADYAAELDAATAELPPHQIGSDGRLMEWLEEYDEHDRHHRHVSHLYGLHPGNQITLRGTPELAQACRATLEGRGDGGTGWSRAWKVNFWARLGDGERALRLLRGLLEPAYTAERPNHSSGTFPNLLCSHPPMQMDGNWGGASGISEMLVQGHDGAVDLLPALPAEWADGSLYGFKVRGGGTIDMTWRCGLPTVVRVAAPGGLRLRFPQGGIMVTINGEPTLVPASGELDVP